MTVSTSTNKAGPYAGAGLPGPFTVPFRFLSASHLQVIKTSAAGIDTELTLTTDYTVAGVGAATGSVTLTAPLASGDRLTIIRDVPFTQLADYVNNDAFPAESHEDALDLLTMQTQQLKERSDAALTLPATAVGADTELPFPQSNKLIGWNEAGTGLQNFDATTLATIVAFGTSRADTFTGNGTQTQFSLTANPGALANLDVAIGGVTQTPGVDYTFSGTTLTFISGAPANGAQILARYFQALPQGVTDSAASTFLQAGTGAVSRNVQAKLRDVVSVRDFGAVGDGVADDTASIQIAVDSIPYGGILLIPSGTYRLTDEIILHAGISVIGEGAADFIFGSPPAYASKPTMLVQTTANKACFRIGGGQHGISIRNMAFSPVVSVTYPAVEAPATDGKCGILLTSSTRVTPPIPNDNGHIWGLELSGLTFYHLHYGIRVTDPNAGDTGAGAYPFDWSVAPALLSNLRFIYPKFGIELNTSNADAWVLTGCYFQIPSAGDGLALRRWGMLRLTNCFAGSNVVSINRFINIYNNGSTNGVEDIVLDSCQAETLTHFLNVQGNPSPSYRYKITCRNCVAELTSDIYLGSPCHFVSENNRWLAQIYVDNANVRISSFDDFFTGAFKFQFLAGSPDTCFVNLMPGPDTSVDYSGVAYVGGLPMRRKGSTSVPNVTTTTLFSLPANGGLYDVYSYIASGGSVYMRTSRVSTDGAIATLLGGEGGAGITISVTGLNVQASQNSGVTQTVLWAYSRVA